MESDHPKGTLKETIAGIDGTCYIAEEPNLSETEFCTSNNGLALRMIILGSKVKVVSVSEPTYDDFECCPYPVMDMDEISSDIIEDFADPEDSALPSR